MVIRYLPSVNVEGEQPAGAGGTDHPMRIVTRRAAGLESGGWTDALRDDVTKYFDELAADWNTRITPGRVEMVRDALSRGLDAMGTPRGLAVELGSGTGAYSSLIAERFATVLAVDLSMEMLKQAPREPAHRIQADGAQLPVRDGSVAAVVLINAFLFPAEVARVLAPDGVVVWMNSSAEQTPIHLSTEEVVARLPGAWNGVSSRAGEGSWCVLRRA
jgi:ubiquinone/menaquinone biosynthesis C-methylase UbiE